MSDQRGEYTGAPAVSLEERRKKNNQKVLQGLKPDNLRVTELEANVSKLIDLVGELEQSLKGQDRYLHRLMELMRKERGV